MFQDSQAVLAAGEDMCFNDSQATLAAGEDMCFNDSQATLARLVTTCVSMTLWQLEQTLNWSPTR